MMTNPLNRQFGDHGSDDLYRAIEFDPAPFRRELQALIHFRRDWLAGDRREHWRLPRRDVDGGWRDRFAGDDGGDLVGRDCSHVRFRFHFRRWRWDRPALAVREIGKRTGAMF